MSGYDLEKKLVIGLASSALFDLKKSDQVFKKRKEKGYRTYQRKNENIPLDQGVAFHFIKRLLSLNEISPEDPLVEVILLSKNDPDTGYRVMSSIDHYQLPITRAIFYKDARRIIILNHYLLAYFYQQMKKMLKKLLKLDVLLA